MQNWGPSLSLIRCFIYYENLFLSTFLKGIPPFSKPSIEPSLLTPNSRFPPSEFIKLAIELITSFLVAAAALGCFKFQDIADMNSKC